MTTLQGNSTPDAAVHLQRLVGEVGAAGAQDDVGLHLHPALVPKGRGHVDLHEHAEPCSLSSSLTALTAVTTAPGGVVMANEPNPSLTPAQQTEGDEHHGCGEHRGREQVDPC